MYTSWNFLCSSLSYSSCKMPHSREIGSIISQGDISCVVHCAVHAVRCEQVPRSWSIGRKVVHSTSQATIAVSKSRSLLLGRLVPANKYKDALCLPSTCGISDCKCNACSEIAPVAAPGRSRAFRWGTQIRRRGIQTNRQTRFAGQPMRTLARFMSQRIGPELLLAVSIVFTDREVTHIATRNFCSSSRIESVAGP